SFQRVAFRNNGFKFGSGTSLATAHFSGILAKAISNSKLTNYLEVNSWMEKASDDSIISITKHDAVNGNVINLTASNDEHYFITTFLEKHTCPKKIKRIAVYPYDEKEMKSLIDFKHLLSDIEITLSIGHPRSIKYNKEIYEKLISLDIPFTNKNLSPAEFEQFDTLVVGYFMDQLL